MLGRLFSLSILAMALSLSSAQTRGAEQLVTLSEHINDYVPNGVTRGSCISVQADGRFHLEVRQQKFPEDFVTLQIYESSLDVLRLQQLRTLLDSPAIHALPAFKPPPLPMSTMTFGFFGAQFLDSNRLLHVGYLTWDASQVKEDQSPASTPASTKEEWRISQMALAPLLQWFHQIQGMNWPQVPQSRSNLCDWVFDQ